MMEEILIKVIYYVILNFTLFCFIIFAHEKAHKEINKLYGIPSEIHLNINRLYCKTNNVTQKQKDKILLAHSINEVLGYPYIIFSSIVTSLLLYLVIF